MTDVSTAVIGLGLSFGLGTHSVRIIRSGAKSLPKVILPRPMNYEYDASYTDRLIRQVQFHIDQATMLMNLIPGLSSATSDLEIRVAALEARVTALEP